MNEMTTDRGLPTVHGVERAAARLHHVAVAKERRQYWSELGDGAKAYFRAAIAHILRDLGPEPVVILDLPLVWYSPSWGILQAEREDFHKGNRNVVSLRHEVVVELPDDAYPMMPLQPCRPGKSLDDIRRPAAPPRRVA